MYISRMIVVFLCVAVPVKSAMAQDEYASFQSFYRDSSEISWPVLIGVAVVTGGIVVATGGVGTPFAASIGTWIGGVMGYTGIAATNAGLAMLGGGSLAAGGFGMLGGTVVIATTTSVATDLLFYKGEQLWSQYDYETLAERSASLPTLGLPVEDAGSILYETAIESIRDRKLENVETEEEVEFVRLVIYQALEQSSLEAQGRLKVSTLGFERNIVFTTEQKARNEALIALLFFLVNDYENSAKHAYLSIEYGRKAGIERGLPAFLYATSSLYKDDINFSEITDQYFEYSIQSQADTDFIPTMFSIYMDRMLLRFEEGKLSAQDLDEIRLLMDSEAISAEYRLANYTLLLSKYNALLDWELEYVSTMTESTNSEIRNSPTTLNRLNIALQRFEQYAEKSQVAVERLTFISNSNEPEEEGVAELNKLTQDWESLVRRLPQLKSMVREFEERQSREILARAEAEASAAAGVNQESNEPETVVEAIVRQIQLLNSGSRVD